MNELQALLNQFVHGLPPAAVAGGIILLVLAGVLLSYSVLVVLGVLFRPGAKDTDGPTMAELADPILRGRRGVGRFDAKFDHLIEGTQLGISGETAVGLILLFGALTAAAVGVLTFEPLPTLLAGLAAGGAVYVFFALLQNRRRRQIQEQLPDGCFQLARSLRSGLNLQGALRETARYVPNPLRGLLGRLGVALSLGESTRESVHRVAETVALTEFDLVTEVVATSAESGGNMPALLDRLASSIRDRNQFRGYFRSATALNRATALFLALAGPLAICLYLIFEPEMLNKFLNAREGIAILCIAIAIEALGLIWLFFMLRRRDDY